MSFPSIPCILAMARNVTIRPLAGLGFGAAAFLAAQPMDFDQQFIDMMVPHHEGAVAMARIALDRAEHQEITAMAQDIMRSQDAEIAQMRAWRLAWYGSDETPASSEMPIVQDMPGMTMGPMTMNLADDVQRLAQAPEPFDQAFIDAMIPHHRSAIDAAQVAEQRAVRQEIRDMARAIIADQQREIAQMEQWRQAWYAAAPTQVPMNSMHGMPGTGHEGGAQ